MAENLYFSNGIVRGQGNNEFRCFLCTNEEVSQDWQGHIKDPQHVSAIRQFRLIFIVNEETIDCKACNASVDWEGLKNHAKWHRIVPWYEIENKDKIFFENRVLNVNSCFICVPCETRFDEWSGAFVHISEEQHHKLIALEPPIHDTFAPTDLSYEFLIAEGFEPWGSNTVKCRPCACPNVRLNNLQEHISQPEHVAAKLCFVADSKYSKKSMAVTEVSQPAAPNLNKNPGASITSRNLDTKSASEKLVAELRSGSFSNLDKVRKDCNSHRTNSTSRMPNSSFRNNNSKPRNDNSHIRRTNSTSRQESTSQSQNRNFRHGNSTTHNGNSSFRNNNVPHAQKHNFPVETRPDGLYCTICNVAVQTTSDLHIAEERHVQALEHLGYEYISPIDQYKFKCSCCNCTVPNLENVFRHIKGMKHRQKIPTAKEKQFKAVESKGETKVETKGEPKPESGEEKEKGKTISFKMNFPRPSDSAINLLPKLPPNQFCQAPSNYVPAMNFPPLAHLNNPFGLNFMPHPEYAPPTNYSPQPLMSLPIAMNSPPQPPPYLPLAINCVRPVMDHALQGKGNQLKFTPENLPRDYIVVQNANDLFCRICDCIIHGHSNVDEHIKDKSHSLMVEDFCSTILPRGENDYYCQRCNATVANRNDLYIHLCQYVHKARQGLIENSHNSNPRKNSNFLSPKKNMTNSSVENNSSSLNVQEKSPIAENSFSRSRIANDFIVILGRLDFCCKLCHIVLSDQTKIESHLQEAEHCSAFRKYEQTKLIRDAKYDCICCKCHIPNFANVPPHVFGDQHKWKSPASSSIRKSDSRELGPDYIVKIGDVDYYCVICNITIVTRAHLDQHLKSEMHANSRNNYGCEQIASAKGSNKNIYCMCCDCNIPDFDCIYVHLSGRRHLDNVAQKRGEKLQQKYNEEIVRKDEEPKQIEKTSGAEIDIRPEVGLENACESVSKISQNEEKAVETGMEISYHEDFEKHFEKLLNKVKEQSPFNLKIESRMKKLAIDGEESLTSRSLASSTMSLNTTGKKLRAPRSKKPENGVFNPDKIFEMQDKLRELKHDIELCVTTYGREDDDIEFRCMVCMDKIEKKSDLYDHFRSYEHCDALKSKRMAHKEYELVSEQYSDYDLAKDFLEEESEDLIHCWVCNIKMSNLDEIVKAHIAKRSHVETRDSIREKNRQLFVNDLEPIIGCNWYDILEYYCTICTTTYDTEFEFVEHAKSSEHVVAVKNIDSSYRPLIHDFCSTCSILWYGERFEFARHVKTPQHASRLGEKSKPETHKQRANISDCLFDICRSGIEEMSVDAYLMRRKFIPDLETTVQQSFPGTKVQIMSSNPVSSESKKFEVLLNFGVKLDQKSEDSVRFLAQRVAAALNDHPARWYMTLINDKTFPIRVTTQHLPSKCKVEIFLNEEVTFTPSKLFNSLRTASVYVEWPIRAVKFCIQLYENEFQEVLRPYIEDTMIFFMQSKSLLPKISDLVQFKGRPLFKPDWDVEVNGLESLKEHLENPREFVIEYHRFYANFDYRREVVSPWIGKPVKKRDFADPQNLPKEMNSTTNSYVPQTGEFFTPFCIQDPFGLMENRTKEISKSQLNGFREYCSWVVETLERQHV